jgi:hypothetical protein
VHSLAQRNLIELVGHQIRPEDNQEKQKDEKEKPGVGHAVLLEAAPDDAPVSGLLFVLHEI